MQRFTQRLVTSLLVPLLAWPAALALLAAAQVLHAPPLAAAGRWLATVGLPLLFALGIGAGFTEGAALALVAAAVAYGVGLAVWGLQGEPEPTALYGMAMGAVGVLAWQAGRRLRLPEWLGFFTGERLAPLLAVALTLPVACAWPLLWAGIDPLFGWADSGLAALGPWGAAGYAGAMRLLMPLGLHHLLALLVDYQLGSFRSGDAVVHGQLLRYLLGDATAGGLTASFIVTVGLCMPAAGLALWHGARPAYRTATGRQVWLTTLAAVTVGTSEGIELGLQASRLLRWTHVVLTAAVAYSLSAAGVRAHGNTLLPALLGLPLMTGPGRLLLLGVAWAAVYYAVVRAIVAWQRPPVLGQVASAGEAPATADDWLAALGGAANVLAVDACMTRLRVQVADVGQVRQVPLAAAGDGLVVQGRQVQVVLGSRAAAVRDLLRAAASDDGGVLLLAPCAGRVVPLAEVPDAAFAQGLLGPGAAVDCQDDLVRSPAAGTVVAVFPGGHAIGIRTSAGLELLVHVGLNTAALQGDGFTPLVAAGEVVAAGQPLVRLQRARLAALGVSLLTPVVVTNAAAGRAVTLAVQGEVVAGAPLLRVR